MTAAEALGRATAILQGQNIQDARYDAGQLLSGCLGVSRLMLLADSGRLIEETARTNFFSMISRRAAHEPLQYILGNQEFMGIPVKVTPAVLIPRADTENLCVQALLRMQGYEHVLDLCTGSGAIALAIKRRMPQASVTASDLSLEAILLARENAARLGLDITFMQGDLFAPLPGMIFDMILCNPPYIPQRDGATLQEELMYEPPMALFGGVDGLDFYRRIVRDAPGYLASGGQLMLELGDGQTEEILALMEDGFSFVTVYKDLSGLNRVVTGTRKG